MEYSAANTALWNGVIQFGIIACAVVFSNVLRRKLPFIRNAMIPTAVLAGFILLLLRSVGWLEMSAEFLEMITYHGIALGFIAMSLRIPAAEQKAQSGGLVGLKSGALIVSTYLVQGFFGLVISLGLAYTIMPDLFKASGILLPMGFGQGPGQANNVGTSFEALGFAGGRSFGLSIAAAGYLCACIVGVIYVNIIARKKGFKPSEKTPEVSGSVTVDTFQDKNEIPISESVDKLSVQVALVVIVYFLTYLVTWGLTSLFTATLPGLANTVNPLIWGFNFIVGSALAIAVRSIINTLRRTHLMTRQYQNNYLLSRISGLAFDVMIVAGIASIDIADLSGLWLPFLLMCVAGAVTTLLHLQYVCKKVYPDYYYEGFVSMYGMLTGTISSGVLLLREIDPQFKTPAANNLVIGSSFAILFGAPMLLLIGIAPQSAEMTFLVLGLLVVYLAALMLIICGKKRPKEKKK